jgi:hypothetical protein
MTAVDHDQITRADGFVLQQEQACFTANAARLTGGVEAIDIDDAHGNT